MHTNKYLQIMPSAAWTQLEDFPCQTKIKGSGHRNNCNKQGVLDQAWLNPTYLMVTLTLMQSVIGQWNVQ